MTNKIVIRNRLQYSRYTTDINNSWIIRKNRIVENARSNEKTVIQNTIPKLFSIRYENKLRRGNGAQRFIYTEWQFTETNTAQPHWIREYKEGAHFSRSPDCDACKNLSRVRTIDSSSCLDFSWSLTLRRNKEERWGNFIGPAWRLQVYYALGTHRIESQMLFTEPYIFIAWQFPYLVNLSRESKLLRRISDTSHRYYVTQEHQWFFVKRDVNPYLWGVIEFRNSLGYFQPIQCIIIYLMDYWM